MRYELNFDEDKIIDIEAIGDNGVLDLKDCCELLNEQQVIIDKLDQENADLLGARIKAQEEWEKCTDKLKEKILEQQSTIEHLEEENEKLTKMLNANYKTNNELVQYIQMLEEDNDE